MYKIPVRTGEVVPKDLAQSKVLDREGREILLESFWAEQPALRLSNDQPRFCQLAFQTLTPREMLKLRSLGQ